MGAGLTQAMGSGLGLILAIGSSLRAQAWWLRGLEDLVSGRWQESR